MAGDAAGLVEQVRHAGPLPPAWQEAAIRAEAEGIPDAALHVARYLLLGKILAFSLDRVPALNRAMKSFNCEIFFSRCSFCDSSRDRICVFCSTMSSYPPV